MNTKRKRQPPATNLRELWEDLGRTPPGTIIDPDSVMPSYSPLGSPPVVECIDDEILERLWLMPPGIYWDGDGINSSAPYV